jgi:ABC-type antimicrobial peptide transport system permease subunit
MLVDHANSPRRFFMFLVASFASLGLLLAALGIYGVISYSVTRQTQEIGVRMALGAQSGDILRMVVRRTVLLALAGIVPGVALAYVAGRSMEALLAGVKPTDAPTLLAAVSLSALMTLIGSVMPTLRALRVDPITALRAE